MLPLGPVRFLQSQLGEDAHEHHDGHHPADDVNDQVGLVLGGVMQGVVLARGGLAGVQPEWSVVVGAGALVQTPLLKRAAEPEATSPAAEDEVARAAVERRVPLAHNIEVAPAEVWRGGPGRGRVRDPCAFAGLPGGGPGAVPPSKHQHAAQLRQLLVPRSLLRPAHAGAELGEKAAEQQPEDSAHRVSQPGLGCSAASGASAAASRSAAEAAEAAAGGCEPPRAAHAGSRTGRSVVRGHGALLSPRSPPARCARRGWPGRSARGWAGGGEWGQVQGAGPAGYKGKRGLESKRESVCPPHSSVGSGLTAPCLLAGSLSPLQLAKCAGESRATLVE